MSRRPIPGRPMPKRRRYRRAVGDAATVGGVIFAILVIVASVVLPLALMAAAIYYLLSHA